jgi:hypothetical protein
MASIELTDKQIRSLRRRLKQDHSTSGRELLAIVEAAMGGRPDHVKCFHCSFVAHSEAEMLEHLLEVEHYRDDPYGEDTAQSNAWDLWHNR